MNQAHRRRGRPSGPLQTQTKSRVEKAEFDASTGWWELTLSCGHEVRVLSGAEAPNEMRCLLCRRENAAVKP